MNRSGLTFELRHLRVVNQACNRSIHDSLHCLVYDMQRHQKPLPRFDGISKPVLDGQVNLRGTKQPVKDVL